jgi:hypothetical protein
MQHSRSTQLLSIAGRWWPLWKRYLYDEMSSTLWSRSAFFTIIAGQSSLVVVLIFTMLALPVFSVALSLLYTAATAQTDATALTIATASGTAAPAGSTDSGSTGSSGSSGSNHLGVTGETFQQAALLDQICNAAKFGPVDLSTLGLTGEDVWAQLDLDQTLLRYFQTEECRFYCPGDDLNAV